MTNNTQYVYVYLYIDTQAFVDLKHMRTHIYTRAGPHAQKTTNYTSEQENRKRNKLFPGTGFVMEHIRRR